MPGFSGERMGNNEIKLEDIPQYQSCFSREGIKNSAVLKKIG